MELAIAMLTQSQSYWCKPRNSEFAMRHASVSRVLRAGEVRCRTDTRYERALV
jgi:hypothetical protein